MIEIQISDYKLLYAACLSRAKDDIRPYLKGVCIKKVPDHEGGGLVYIGTSGRLLTVVYDNKAKSVDFPADGIVLETTEKNRNWPRCVFPKLKKGEQQNRTASIILNRDTEGLDCYREKGVLTIPEMKKEVSVNQIICDYPIFSKVAFNEDRYRETQHWSNINTKCLDIICQISKMLDQGAVHFHISKNEGEIYCVFSELETFTQYPIISLVMPIRMDPILDELPEFVKWA